VLMLEKLTNPSKGSYMDSDKSFEDQCFEADESFEFAGHEFISCQFIGLNLAELSLKGARFIECSFKRCNLSNASVTGASFRDVQFDHCKIIGVNWSSVSSFFELQFRECQLNYCVFQSLKMGSTVFKKCSLREVDFSESDLKNSNFSFSDLSASSFSGCNLEKADFRGAVGYVIDLSNVKIRKAVFSLPEVIGLLHQFEIEIE